MPAERNSSIGPQFISFDVHERSSQRSGNSFTLCVDIHKGHRSLIQKVEFHEVDSLRSAAIKTAEVSKHVVLNDGSSVPKRYQARLERKQDSTSASFVVRLVSHDGMTTEVKHKIDFKETSKGRRFNRRTVAPLPRNRTFGIELELSDADGSSRSSIAKYVEYKAGVDVTVFRDYRDAHTKVNGWNWCTTAVLPATVMPLVVAHLSLFLQFFAAKRIWKVATKF